MNLEKHKLKFIQYKQRGLKADEYTLSVNVGVTEGRKPALPTKDIIDAILSGKAIPEIDEENPESLEKTHLENFSNNFAFAVTGKRLKLHDEDLHYPYPPANSKGDYSDVIPYIVLNDGVLAWTRYTGQSKGHDLCEGLTDEEVPFLWLVVVDEVDTAGILGVDPTKTPSVLPLRNLTWGELSFNKDEKEEYRSETLSPAQFEKNLTEKKFPESVSLPENTDTPLPNRFHYFAFKREESSETASDPVVCLDIKRKLLEELLPDYRELAYLAHNRQLKDENDNDIGPEKTVVLSNRIISDFSPASGEGRFQGYLVTLEQRYNEQGFDFGEAKSDDYVRLNVLHSWKFGHKKEGPSFADRVRALKTSLLEHTLTEEPPKIDGVKGVPLKHFFRQGGRSFSWYHGPLLAAKNRLLTNLAPLTTRCADELVAVDEKHGMFDVSYGAAWQIGRLLALQNLEFATKLLNWKVDHFAMFAQIEHDSLYTHLAYRRNNPEAGSLPGSKEDILTRQDLLDCSPPKYSPIEAEHIEYILELLKIREIVDRTQRVAEGLDFSEEIDRLNFGLEEKEAQFKKNLVKTLEKRNVWTPYRYLESLSLLQGIPLNFLVPNEKMVPPESLKFFYLDWFWVESLLQGAFSIANSMNESAVPDIKNNTELEIKQVTGIILRSQLVADFPELKVDASEKEVEKLRNIPAAQRLEVLRNDQLNEETRLFLFRGNVKYLDLYLRPDGLHYRLNAISPLRDTEGHQIEGQEFGEVPFRNQTQSILNMNRLMERIPEAESQSDEKTTKKTSAQMGMQLIRGSEKLRFIVNPNGMEILNGNV